MASSWLDKRLFALVLAVLITLGMAVPSVGAGSMAAKVAMAAEMGPSGTADCGACTGGNDGKAIACPVSFCTAPRLAAAVPVVSAMVAQASRKLPLPGAHLLGWTSLPDP